MVEARRRPALDCAAAVAAAAGPGERRLLVAAGSAASARPALLEAVDQLGLGDAALRGQLADDMAGVVAGFLAAFGGSGASCAEVRIDLADGQVRAWRCSIMSPSQRRGRSRLQKIPPSSRGTACAAGTPRSSNPPYPILCEICPTSDSSGRACRRAPSSTATTWWSGSSPPPPGPAQSTSGPATPLSAARTRGRWSSSRGIGTQNTPTPSTTARRPAPPGPDGLSWQSTARILSSWRRG